MEHLNGAIIEIMRARQMLEDAGHSNTDQYRRLNAALASCRQAELLVGGKNPPRVDYLN